MSALRQRLFKDADVGAAFRDVDDALDKLEERVVKRTLDDVYSAPMYLSFNTEPFGLTAVRIRDLTSLEAPLLHQGPLSFVWEPGPRRARIPSIDGLVAGTAYRFNFKAEF